MIFKEGLLYIEPTWPASQRPVVDFWTRRLTHAFRLARRSDVVSMGKHRCVCGAWSTSFDYVLPGGLKTHSLCIHYLALHRQEVPWQQLIRVALLPSRGGAMPTGVEIAWPPGPVPAGA
jgi:hypothetical protein